MRDSTGGSAKDKPNVLVVDDDTAVRELLVEGLDTFGYPAITASDIDEAFEIVKRQPIGLVLSDIDMPGGDGLQLLKRIKEYDADLDVIMVTGAVDADTAVQAIRRGASDYVTKPFNLDEVQIVVARTLEKRRLILENQAHQERLEELVSIVQFIDRHRLGPTYRFLHEHQKRDDHGRVIGYRRLDQIRDHAKTVSVGLGIAPERIWNSPVRDLPRLRREGGQERGLTLSPKACDRLHLVGGHREDHVRPLNHLLIQ